MDIARQNLLSGYAKTLADVVSHASWDGVGLLAGAMAEVWHARRQVFVCGNGGSAANAIHWANDFLYPLTSGSGGRALRIHALSANVSCLTCIANDKDYSEAFSHQLETLAEPGDLLVVLSGSGNSPNIVRALESARAMKLQTAAVLGYSGGKALALADIPIHFAVDDMQIAEDLQLVVAHMILRALKGVPHA